MTAVAPSLDPAVSRVAAEPAAQARPEALSRLHVPELDGVRAIAIWLVLLLHGMLGFANPDGALDGVPRPIYEIISHGWLGVDLFFCLSGLLITGILLDAKGKPGYYRNFYGRRALRILPLFLVCLAVMPFFYPGYGKFFLISIPFLSNFAHAFGAATPHGPGVLWSLCVEEHFYLLWPFAVMHLSRRGLTFAAAAVIVVSPLLRLWAMRAGWDIDNQIYPYSFFRFDGIATGSLLAIWLRSAWATRHASMKLAAAMLAGFVVISVVGLPFDIMSRSVAGVSFRYTQMNLVFGAFVLMAWTLRGSWMTAPLRSRFAIVSGALSYCLYLIHLAVGDAYVALTRPWEAGIVATVGGFGSVVIRTAVVIGVSFALAVLSQRYLEGPALRLKRFFA